MTLSNSPSERPLHLTSSGALDSRLHGGRLVLARTSWVLLAVFVAAFFLANLPVYLAQLHTVCLRSRCARWQLTPASAKALQQIHLSSTSYALMSLVVSVSAVLVWFAVAVFIAWRKSRQWLALLTSLLMLAQGITQMSGSLEIPLQYSAPVWHPAILVDRSLEFSLFLLVFALFPNGRFAPGWMRWVVALMLPVFLAYALALSSMAPSRFTFTLLSVGVWSVMICGIIAAQIHRYRRVSTPTERQQTKWVVLSFVVGPLVGAVYFLLPVFLPVLGQPDSLYYVLVKPAYNVLWLFIPLCVGIAILRYRLWDIDVLIRRTLVYGTLTALLAALYLGLVISVGGFVRAVFGLSEQEPLIVVGSTLAVFALVTPLRRGIQRFIDRRFYRSKYDAARTLAAFGATLRTETDLGTLSVRLVLAVQETMQPAHVSLWLSTLPRDSSGARPPIGVTPRS